MPTPPVILHRRARGRSRGMSLVEVMVVLVIIGVVGTLAVLRWRTADPAQALTEAAEDFSRLIRYQCESVLLDALQLSDPRVLLPQL